MTAPSVTIERLQIDRVRGIGRGEEFSLDDLSPGINLISGSNGSGKSTTALVIQELLWPGESGLGPVTVSGTLRMQGQRLEIEVNHGAVEVRRDGLASTLPAFAPAESRPRHHLALHELIGATDRDFAKRIADAGRGGFDLAKAAAGLEFTDRPRRSNTATKAVDDASRALRNAQATSLSLAQRERNLASLKAALEAARTAERSAHRLDLASRRRSAADTADRLREELDALPAGVRQLRGDERTRLGDLDTRVARITDELDSRRHELHDAEASLATAALPESGIDETALQGWAAQGEAPSAIESEIGADSRALVRAESLAAKRRDQIGPHVADDALESIDADARHALEDFSNRARALGLERAELDATRRRLTDRVGADRPLPETDTIRHAIAALGRWLEAPPIADDGLKASGSAADPMPGRIAAVIIALLFLFLAIVSHWAWIFGLAIAIAIFLWSDRSAPKAYDIAPASAANERRIHRAAFERLGMDAPTAWEVDAVASRLAELVRALAERERDEIRFKELARLAADRAALDGQFADLDAERIALEARLGIPIGMEAAWLPAFVTQLAEWQASRAEAHAAAATLAATRTGLREAIDRFNASLGSCLGDFAPTPAATSSEARAQVETLSKRELRRAAAVAARDSAARAIARIETERTELAAQRTDLFVALDLADGDETTLDAWLARVDDRSRLAKQLRDAEAIRDAHGRDLGDDPELLSLDADTIAVQQREAADRAKTRDDLLEQIVQIEESIKAAQAGQEVQQCIERRDRALAALDDQRERASLQLVGHRLVEFVRGIDADSSRPAVFGRADALLNAFTRGALSLELDDRDAEPTFRVRRGNATARSVEELSRGERIQTLIAVRLAFLQLEESAILPLLLDETLATSDDRRTETIIDTVIEIARSGRQIFCFTAQQDEVGKWTARLTGSDLPFRHLDLDEVRGAARSHARPFAALPPMRPSVPEPGTEGHEAYGARLGVPQIDPWDEPQDGLHPWHVIDDPSVLHRCLADGIENCGQLRALIQRRSALLEKVGLDATTSAMTLARVAAIARACALWRDGRSAPIDRRVLAGPPNSPVTERFLDDVTSLLAECGGDPSRLLDRIESIKGWGSTRTEALREWFVEHGHLDESPRLTRDELRCRMLVETDGDRAAGHLTADFIDRVIAGLPE